MRETLSLIDDALGTANSKYIAKSLHFSPGNVHIDGSSDNLLKDWYLYIILMIFKVSPKGRIQYHLKWLLRTF